MKFTLSWLRDHLDGDAPLERIVETLIRIGLEIEEVTDPGAALAPFRVAHVVSAEQHPNADRLRVCRVDTGDGVVQVVCGAPNARAGMKGVFAPPGTWIPGIALELKPSSIRGVESAGMLLSERELGLSDEHAGIVDLPAETKVGTPVAAVLGLDDPVIDVAITPNRPDCTGVRGIARDLAAAGLGTLKPLKWGAPNPGSYTSPIAWAIAPDGNSCAYVTGRHFRGVENGQSPDWLQRRLRAIGLRPISALVDVTNYVMIDLGRPLHVFDAGVVKGGTLTMRRARQGEPFHALTGKDFTLDDSMTVIGDGDEAEGLAGIMGGMASAVQETTTEAFLEVAWFDPVKTAATGRALELLSDARYRFERGVDPDSCDWGAEVAANMIAELCGGETSAIVRAGTKPVRTAPLVLRADRVRALAGLDLPFARQAEILSALGFKVSRGDEYIEAVPPSWRPDVHGEADLVEEIARIAGFDAIAPVSLDRVGPLPAPALTPAQRRTGAVRRALAARGLDEAVTWSFTSAALAGHFGGTPDALRLLNPISADLDVMRPTPLANIAAAAGRNADRGYGDIGLFEVGPGWREADSQQQIAAAMRLGRAGAPHWAEGARPVDAFDAKADALAALEAAGAPVAGLAVTRDAPAWYHPGRSGTLRLGKLVLAQFGELDPRLIEALGLRGPAVACEVLLDAVALPRMRGTAKPALKLSAFQPVRRDFAFVVAAGVPAAAVLEAARKADRALIADVTLFDVYTGKGVPEGQKSLALTVTLQPQTATLTEAEIDAVAQKIVAAVAKETKGTLRG